uniref:Protein kinase domain-containing protein n=1 Tax=Ascaris lumbricoides TaxID=6252 RepID=A0A0M3HT27_ASCLU
MSCILYQICCGVSYPHFLGITYRDLKPSDIGVNGRGCIVKILDVGLAGREDDLFMSPYVTTRFYRAPEVIFGMQYDEQVDMWSIGRIFAELILGIPLFCGKDPLDHWYTIVALMGTPDIRFTRDLSPISKFLIDRMPWQPCFSF